MQQKPVILQGMTGFLYFVNLIVFGIFCGGQAGFCLKNPAKVIQARKSAGFGNFRYGQIGVCEQPFGFLQAKLQNILLGGGGYAEFANVKYDMLMPVRKTALWWKLPPSRRPLPPLT